MNVNENLIGCIIIVLLLIFSNILIFKIISRKSKRVTLLDVYTSKGKIKQVNNKCIIPIVFITILLAIITISYIIK